MAHGITGIDHALVGVGDLEGARRRFERLGFTTTPRGRHDAWDTANYCIMFAGDYLELLGTVAPARTTGGLDRLLAERGEGLAGIALATADTAQAHAALAASGLAAAAPQALGRSLETPEGALRPSFTLVHLTPEAAPLSHESLETHFRVFRCQHRTPELMRRPEWLTHANGAAGIAAITVVTEEPGRLGHAFERLFGAGATAMTDDTLAVFTGNGAILFVTPEDLAVLYPGVATEDVPLPYIAGLSLKVADPERTAECLAAAGVPFTRGAEGAVRVAPKDACGVVLQFAL